MTAKKTFPIDSQGLTKPLFMVLKKSPLRLHRPEGRSTLRVILSGASVTPLQKAEFGAAECITLAKSIHILLTEVKHEMV
jgi:hypothetical protein